MATQTAPRPDFSEKAISKAVTRATSQHPSVLYPAGAAVVGGLAAVALGPSLAALGVLIGGGALAAAGWAFNRILRRDYFANRYVRKLREATLAEHAQAMEDLERDLTEIESREGLSQLRRAREKFNAFCAVLNRKLKPEELTHSRYLGIAEQVYFAVLDNLKRIAGVTRSAAAIDVDYTRGRIDELKAGKNLSAAREQELNSLKRRLALADEQTEKIHDWLADNEDAMTQLDHTAMALAATETKRGLAEVNLETAMAELARLAGQAQQYDRDNLGL